MKTKRLLALLLTLALTLTLAVGAAASGYTDLDGHWAKDYMEDLASRGYLNGYGDGRMGPDDEITAAQILALVSRMYTVTDDAAAAMEEDYGAFVDSCLPGSMAWFHREAVLCLAAGICTRDEFSAMKYSEPLKKELAVKYIVRAMQLEDEALALKSYELPFTDVDKISADCLPHAAMLYSLKIIVGDDLAAFNPAGTVARCVISTMVSRALDYLESKKLTLTVDSYEGLEDASGVIVEVTGSKICVRGTDGIAGVYSLSGAGLTLNGTAASSLAGHAGDWAELTVKDGVCRKAAVTSDANGGKWVQGVLTGKFAAVINPYLNVRVGSDAANYTVGTGAAMTQDGSAATMASLASGSFVSMLQNGGKVSRVIAVTGSQTLKGKITELTYGATVRMIVTGGSDTWYFPLNIASLPAIYRGETAVGLDRLSVGDTVTVAVTASEVTKISTASELSSVSGKLTAISVTAAGTSWAVETADGALIYTLDPGATAAEGSVSLNISLIGIGDTLTLEVYDSIIYGVVRTAAASGNESGKLTGSVLSVSAATNQVIVLTGENKLVYVNTKALVSITNSSTGYSIPLGSLAPGSGVIIYGTRAASGVFNAVTIIVE